MVDLLSQIHGLIKCAPWVPLTRAQAREWLGIAPADIEAIWTRLEAEGRLLGGSRNPARRSAPRGEIREIWIEMRSAQRTRGELRALPAPSKQRIR